MFRYTITPSVQSDLARFDELARRFDLVTTLPRTWSGRVRRDLEAQAIGASVALEGVPVTVDEVRRLLAGDQPAGVSDTDSELVRGYRDAMGLVLRRADDPSFSWSAELFRGIHDRVMGASWAAGAGRIRERQNWLQDRTTGAQVYMPPPNHDVARLLDGLAIWMNEHDGKLPGPVLAALVHVRLAAIHPFADGNGRTARIAASLAMYRGGFRRPEFTSLEEWWGSHPRDYYDAFGCLGAEWDADADVTPFVAAHVRAQVSQAEALSLRLATEKMIWAALEDIVAHDLGMDARAANALWDAFFGREVTNRYYRGSADVAPVIASHDLKQLQTSGLLAGVGAGRSRSYRGTMALMRRVVDALGIPVDVRGDVMDDDIRPAIVAAVADRVRC